MKIAIVHDYLHQFGGAERVVSVLHEMFPDAPIYTSIYNPKNFPDNFRSMDIRISFMQNIPLIFNNFRAYFPLYPIAFKSFNLDDYDLIISSSSAFAKGIRKGKHSKHVCYCHNPMRFVWRFDDYIKKEPFPAALKCFLKYALLPLRKWDLDASNKVDYFIANSQEVHDRIVSIYKRDSVIIYPPIETDKFTISETDSSYFLIVSRLAAYKKIDQAILAFNKLDLPLKIVGTGPAIGQLSKIAGNNIEFLGKINDSKLKTLYSECRALIVPGIEDFGMAPLEAAASGRPTIAYAAGGALETIIDGKTGILFKEQSLAGIIEAIKKLENLQFDKDYIQQYSRRFDKEVFKNKLRSFLNEKNLL